MATRKFRLAPMNGPAVTHTVRASKQEHQFYKRAAKKREMTLNAWFVTSLNEAAERDLNRTPQENNGTTQKTND